MSVGHVLFPVKDEDKSLPRDVVSRTLGSPSRFPFFVEVVHRSGFSKTSLRGPALSRSRPRLSVQTNGKSSVSQFFPT